MLQVGMQYLLDLNFFCFWYIIYLFECQHHEKESERELAGSSLGGCCGQGWARLKLGSSSWTPTGWQVPDHLGSVCCFPQAIGRQLCRKWSSWEQNERPYRCWDPRRQLYMPQHRADPKVVFISFKGRVMGRAGEEREGGRFFLLLILSKYV